MQKKFSGPCKKSHRFSDLGAITGGTLLLLISNFSFGGPFSASAGAPSASEGPLNIRVLPYNVFSGTAGPEALALVGLHYNPALIMAILDS
jgi:hypothetical protein